MKPIKLKTISLKKHAEYNERWLHDAIAEDPSVLGVGDVIVKDRERLHPGTGRLDILLQDADGHGRYEMEIQLGASDESHIIRTIEYWDIERRRYPQYDHTAVIVAEDISECGLDMLDYDNRWGNYKLRLNREDIKKNREIIKNLLAKAYDLRK